MRLFLSFAFSAAVHATLFVGINYITIIDVANKTAHMEGKGNRQVATLQ